ncbi:semaphorin-6B-like [Misgurnus anguillicaudatus]|uniref:semaphorin-6B-like n=1 Tax=Misgurnus anguillicaudatus TaxID=75329 RepID=UPI003CCF4D04
MVCWIMSLKLRQRSRGGGSGLGSRRKSDKEQSMLGHGRSGSIISVTRISGVDRPRSQVENMFSNGWPKSGDIDTGLPTPEQTPLQQKRPTPNVHLTDCDWDQTHTFLAQTGTPNSAVIYLSSKYLQGGRQEGSGDMPSRYLILSHPPSQREQGGRVSAPTTRNSAGEYNYPATPQDSPDRRRVVSAPTTQTDYGENVRWSRDELNLNSNNATPSGHHPYPIQPRTNAALVRPTHHTQRGLGELQDYSHLLVKSVNERNPNGQ